MKKNILLTFAIAVATLIGMTSCSDDDVQPRLPEFGTLTFSKSTVAVGENFKATLTFKDQGSYVKGTYTYSTMPVSASATGSFQCGSSQSSCEFTVTAPEEPGTYTLTVRPKSMSANAGSSPYIDPASMGSISAKLVVE